MWPMVVLMKKSYTKVLKETYILRMCGATGAEQVQAIFWQIDSSHGHNQLCKHKHRSVK